VVSWMYCKKDPDHISDRGKVHRVSSCIKKTPDHISHRLEFLPAFSCQRSPVDGPARKRAVQISHRGQVGRFPAAVWRPSWQRVEFE